MYACSLKGTIYTQLQTYFACTAVWKSNRWQGYLQHAVHVAAVAQVDQPHVARPRQLCELGPGLCEGAELVRHIHVNLQLRHGLLCLLHLVMKAWDTGLIYISTEQNRRQAVS